MSRAHIEHGGEQELEAGGPGHEPSEAGAGPALRRALVGLGLFGLLGALGSAAGCGGAPESSPAEPASAPADLGEAQSALSTATLCLKIPAVDTTLSKEKPYDNYGNGSFLSSGASATGVPAQFRALLKFNTKAVPQDATVISAKVTLNQTNTGVAKPGVHLVIFPWVETGVTWDGFAGSYQPVPFATLSLASPTVTFDILPQAKDWVSHAVQNRGILIEQDGSKFVTKYKSAQYAVASQQPVLNLCYKVSCAAGTADCDGNAADGCEADLSSTASCGACGHVCSLPHAGAGCAAGACTLGACDEGWGDCDGNAANGCEASLALHAGSSNCGACGVSCPACGGFLGLSCPPGLDCIDDPSDGCDPLHFGHDCSGLCLAPSGASCGSFCNGPDALTCPQGLACAEEPVNPGSDPLAPCVPPIPCSGFGTFSCPNPGHICWDDPTDDCDSASNPSCPGRCIAWFDTIPRFCGGTAHLGCDVGSICQDVPCDGCDPASGDVNCLGECAPAPVEACPYACNGFGGFTCPLGLSCVDLPCNGNDCAGACVPPTPCYGIGGFNCPSWEQMCVDNPTDNCDPAINPNCPGHCVSWFDPGPAFCGGALGQSCPQGSTCNDIPCDGCDPANGGIDCPGACSTPLPSCTAPGAQTCQQGMICHDDSSDACAPGGGGVGCPGACTQPLGWCGGPDNIPCAAGTFCVDHPNSGCVGPECEGVCVAPCAQFPSCY
jgi:hypothetical protein